MNDINKFWLSDNISDNPSFAIICGLSSHQTKFQIKESDNYVYLDNFADKDSLYEIACFLSRSFPSGTINKYVTQNYPNEALRNNRLILIGGPNRNHITKELLEQLSLPLSFVPNSNSLLIKDIKIEAKYKANEIIFDYGLFITFNNPFNIRFRSFIFSGLHTYGVLGISKLFLDDIYGQTNREYIEEIAAGKDYSVICALVPFRIVKSEVIIPKLKENSHLLFGKKNESYELINNIGFSYQFEESKDLSSDSFLKSIQPFIKDLSKYFCQYLRDDSIIIDELLINAWLRQFGTLENIQIAWTLLNNYDFYSKARIESMFSEFLSEIDEEFDNIIVSTFGNPIDSSNIINYVLGEIIMRNNIRTADLREILDSEEINFENTSILFIDDNIGSGKQAALIFYELMGKKFDELSENHKLKLSFKQQKIFKKCKIYFYSLIGFHDGIKKVENEAKILGLNLTIFHFKSLKGNIGCFHPASNLFMASPSLKKTAMELCQEISLSLFEDKNWSNEKKINNSLGYGDSQKLISFFYNTPTTTLPIFWKKGFYKNTEWICLFPRREKNTNSLKL